MATGTVKWFNATKGLGFIQPDDGGKEVFVHISAVERAGLHDLNEGQRLAYVIVVDKHTGRASAGNLRAAQIEAGFGSQKPDNYYSLLMPALARTSRTHPRRVKQFMTASARLCPLG